MNDNRKALRAYVSDMLALERHILEPTEHQLHAEDVRKYPLAHAIVKKSHGTMTRHLSALEAHLTAIGGHPAAPLKTAVGTVLGAAASVVNAVRRTEASKGLRDLYAALSLDSVSYSMLHAAALALGEASTAALAQHHLEEISPLIIELSKVIPNVVIDELKAEGLDVDSSVKEAATADAETAWR